MAPRMLAISGLAALYAASASPEQLAGCAAGPDETHVSMLQIAPATGPLGSSSAEGIELLQALAASDPRTPPGGGDDLDMSLLLEDHRSTCHTVFLTTVFGSRPDPQGKIHKPPTFDYIDRYYRSILAIPGGRAQAVVLYDTLPLDVIRNYSTGDGTVQFVNVDISGMDEKLGLNDLRYQVFEEQVKKHPEWDTIFMTDASDVIALHNPCVLVDKQPDKIFVGSQPQKMKPYTYIQMKFGELGGKYFDWYMAQPDGKLQLLNAGIIGGRRAKVLDALARMNKVLLDPELAIRRNGSEVKVNMPAFNYVFHAEFGDDKIVTGAPLHSKFWEYEARADVYFKHK
eukprot:CAMPEP_0176067148 /NCGR_PEP_ID=MMETSP0120_2-20121206/33514_1 /TAXON_ID=160619 /ORGANISM="Kryptoperidinium foliaceum, Strain CCMP 1326" /LENGTH=341 /DNA_ID=CAMNT_0017400761 /DNA_START=51 /DNA_END=1076 /DNA_ORIENTATION=+